MSDGPRLTNPVTGLPEPSPEEEQRLEPPSEEEDTNLLLSGRGQMNRLSSSVMSGELGERDASHFSSEPGQADSSQSRPSDQQAGQGNDVAAQRTLQADRSRIGHIFRDEPGHLPDTPENRKALERVANDPKNFLGPDEHGALWWGETRPDGTQVWARTRGGRITNGGINLIPKSYNSKTGLTAPNKPAQGR